MRSERANEPTLSCPAFQPIARWTIETSSVSPERAVTIVFRQRILDRDDRIAVDPAKQHLDHSIAVELATLEAKPIAAVATELGGRNVERDRDLAACCVARALDAAKEHRERFLIGVE